MAADPLAALQERYAIRVAVADEPFRDRWGPLGIHGRPPDADKAASYAAILGKEFAVYPVDFVKRSKLKSIRLCTGLRFGRQRRTALHDHRTGTLYLDVERGRHDDDYVRRVIHHEYFHMVDYADDGEVYRDDDWAALNPEGFRYGASGASAQRDPTASLATDDLPGFLNRYSTTGVEEDKAEFFAHLIHDHDRVAARARKDPIVRRKMLRMKELLERFCPEIDERFWHARRGR